MLVFSMYFNVERERGNYSSVWYKCIKYSKEQMFV